MTTAGTLIRIVIADDSPVFLRTVCSFLNQYSRVEVVATAATAADALHAVDRLRPDLVLLDFQMPVMNGLETMVQIHRQSPATRVVLLTGHDTPELREASLEGGAIAFISKLDLSRELPALLAKITASRGNDLVS